MAPKPLVRRWPHSHNSSLVPVFDRYARRSSVVGPVGRMVFFSLRGPRPAVGGYRTLGTSWGDRLATPVLGPRPVARFSFQPSTASGSTWLRYPEVDWDNVLISAGASCRSLSRTRPLKFINAISTANIPIIVILTGYP